MKVTKGMKAKKKTRRVSKIPRGSQRKAMVLRGSKEKTSGGLKKDRTKKNKEGKVVSKKASAASKKRYAGSALEKINSTQKVSKIARGNQRKAMVLRGSKAKTPGGLTKNMLKKNQEGKVVSKKASAASKKRYAGSALQKWFVACSKARKELRLTGFVAVGGKSATGKALYARAMAFFA